ncbi:MAG: hypothetical protein WDN44_11315 [Sphingomonas sp.]
MNFGVIATAGYSNKWRTRDVIQQQGVGDLSQKFSDFRRVITEDRIVANGLLGLSLEYDGAKIRETTLYIRDTLKQARMGLGQISESPGVDFLQQNTAWFERQLIDTQLVGEFKLTPELSIDIRGAYANSKRNAPDEIGFTYSRSNAASDPMAPIISTRSTSAAPPAMPPSPSRSSTRICDRRAPTSRTGSSPR